MRISDWSSDVCSSDLFLLDEGMPREEFAALNRFAAQTFGARADQISLLYVLHYIHSAGSYTLLESMDGGAQQDRIDGGSQAVSLALRSKLGDSVRQIGRAHV